MNKLVFLALCLALANPFKSEDPRRSSYATDVPYVAGLVHADRERGTYCTASAVAPGVMITAAHCVDSMDQLVLIKIGERRVPFVPVFIGEELSPTDFAILQGDTTGLDILELGDKAPEAGDIAFFVGFAGNDLESINSMVFFSDETAYTDGIPGDSGGPVVQHGKLVGIIYAGAPWAPHYTLFCPLSELRAKFEELGLLKPSEQGQPQQERK